LLLAAPPGYASAIFPPAGIAVAVAFIAGRVTLPWVFAGSFALNLWIGYSLQQHSAGLAWTVALIIATGSALQAAVGSRVLRQLVGYPVALDNVRDVGRFLLMSPLVCVISATWALAGMAALGVVDVAELIGNWFSWWIGDTLGVLLFLPLVMVLVGEPRPFWRSRSRSVALPMLMFFALFVAIFVRTKTWERNQSQVEFQLLSRTLIDKVNSAFTAQEDLLAQLRASWSGSVRQSRRDFASLTEGLLLRHPDIQAVEWAPRVAHTGRAQFVAGQQDMPSFTIRELAAKGDLAPANDRAEFYPVTNIEPLKGNEPAIGFDLASDPARRTAIERTVASGAVAVTAPISLVQSPGDHTGILLMLSVASGANGSGVLLVVLRLDRFIDALIGPASQSLGVRLVDRETHQALFDSLPSDPGPYEQSQTFGGRTYDIWTQPTALYFVRHQSWQSWLVLVIGVLSTSLLGAFLLVSTGESQRFARLLAVRTRERDRIWQVSEDLLGVSTFEGYFPSVNPAWTRTLGWSEEEIKSIHVSDLRHPDDAPIGIEGRRRLAEGARTVRMENRFRHKDGSYHWISWTMTAEQELIYVIGRDVTADREAAAAHRQTEEQLRQLQKVDSIGQLTGGIAHDFNNLLTVIMGNLQILERIIDAGSTRAVRCVRAAMSGATRAATLTQRLLAYAQRQPLRPRAVDLNELVSGMGDLIRRTQGEMIDYEFVLGNDLPPCFCDANQLEMALLNLVINARDAMPHGGRLKIETARFVFDATQARVLGILPGPYVMLAVSDTGIGMSRETADRAFEPFFTTKGTGKGTGLGLSMVYGFVKQSNGHIDIESEPRVGTTLRIVLPAMSSDRAPERHDAGIPPRPVDAWGTGETILVAEDDAGVRGYVVEVLSELNYRVLEASDAVAALAIITGSDRIDLLVTDVVMPGMNGRELANQARGLLPSIRVLFMTGYSEDAIVRQGRLDPDIELIEKPFRRESLAARVRAMLDTTDTGVVEGQGVG
jgi:PAS domain S-box-containing protein